MEKVIEALDQNKLDEYITKTLDNFQQFSASVDLKVLFTF